MDGNQETSRTEESEDAMTSNHFLYLAFTASVLVVL